MLHQPEPEEDDGHSEDAEAIHSESLWDQVNISQVKTQNCYQQSVHKPVKYIPANQIYQWNCLHKTIYVYSFACSSCVYEFYQESCR